MADARLPGRRAAIDAGVVAEFLAATALFRSCDRSVVDRVAPHVAAFEVPAGSAVIKAGSPDAQIGLLFAGKVAMRQVNASTGQGTVVEELRVGDFFGEIGAMLQLAQPHEATAVEDSTVLLLGKDVVEQLATKVPGFAHAIARRLSTRIVQQSVAAMRSGPAAAQPAVAPAAAAPLDKDAIRFVRISTFPCDDKTLSMVPAKLITQYRVLPLETRGRVVTIGMVDPFNSGAAAELRRLITSADVNIVAISADDWSEAVVRHKVDPGARGAVRGADAIAPDQIQYEVSADGERDAIKAPVIGEEVVAMASRIIAAGVERGCSDIHIETDTTGIRVRFRVSGTLIDWDQFVAASYGKGLAARIKVLAGLDITEKRLPQDGRIGLRVARREIDLRVSTLPASRGEKIVMRVLEASSMMRPLDAIFLEPSLLRAVRNALNKPHGAIVVAGPTGSGKSSTLYSALNERRKTRPDSNIVMVEDPVEYRLQGATQVQVNHAVDMTFARVLRSFLRQDPDVIMVGEIRDRETASMALEAAMTGHLLFTSIHANDALGVLQRFENLGCHRQQVAQALSLVLVQRLARKPCPRCVTSEPPAPILAESLVARGLIERAANLSLPRGTGCAECQQTGYQGRVAVLEALEFTDPVSTTMMGSANLSDVEKVGLDTGAYTPFRRYAAYLMSRNLLTPTEALLTVA